MLGGSTFVSLRLRIRHDETLDPVETIFTTVIDRPVPGYYWYILEVAFQDSAGGTLFVTEMEMDLRSLSAQVVKP